MDDPRPEAAPEELELNQSTRIGEMFFQYRDYTPVPLILLMFFVSEASVFSAFLGTIVVLAGEWIRIIGVSYIGAISRTRKNQTGGALVTEGPYGLVRNPLYVGNFFMVCGIAIFTGVLWFFLLAVALFAAQYHFIVAYEEHLLEQKFPETFPEYKATVPRWIPKDLSQALSLDLGGLNLAMAFRSEKRTLLAAFLILAVLSILS